MKNIIYLLCALLLYTNTGKCQDTTKVLFIGNSFTGVNDLQAIVHQFFDFDKLPVQTYAYAPGGISVGDVAMGTDAHMNNPLVYDLIRQNDWDFLVLQDNQGRFALDSAVFPSVTKSKVIEGHIKIRDSFHYYHSCGKMIWFSGWGFQDEDTTMINQITTNYRVLNDIAKDVIAPIGPGWRHSFIVDPAIQLWSPDGAHPATSGSFLTAAIIYGTITGRDIATNKFMYVLPPHEAISLKNTAQFTLADLDIKLKSNLGGIQSAPLLWDKTKLKGPKGKIAYQWYQDQKLLSSAKDSFLIPTKSGTYRLWIQDGPGTWQKSCDVSVEVKAGIRNSVYAEHRLQIFPNPAKDIVSIQNLNTECVRLDIFSIRGEKQMSYAVHGNELNIDIDNLSSGYYFIKCFDRNENMIGQAEKLLKQ